MNFFGKYFATYCGFGHICIECFCFCVFLRNEGNMITYPFASKISSLGSVPVCRECAAFRVSLRCVGVSCCQSNCDFACCPDAMQKTDSEMSAQGDECKPEHPSVPLQLNVVLRNATTIKQVQCTKT